MLSVFMHSTPLQGMFLCHKLILIMIPTCVASSCYRKQGGLPLSLRATLATWPCSTNVTNGGDQGISFPATMISSQPKTGLGTA
jgi:hypothetical protein